MENPNGKRAPQDGCIPLTVRIGVTGHRKLDDRASLIPAVREALLRVNELLPRSPRTEVVPVVVSALAEGADCLVAEQVLAEAGSRLEAVLPLAPEEYLEDFEHENSRREFRNLLARASAIWQYPRGASREEAYEQVGHYIVDHSDVIIALWDGQPAAGRGGTATIVAYAREQGVPLLWVKTKGQPLVISELTATRASVIQDGAGKLDEYNASVIPEPDFQLQVRVQREHLMPEVPTSRDALPLMLAWEKASDWLIPYLIRADVLAWRLQSRFRLLSSAIFVMAAAAVVVVAVQANFLPAQNWVVGVEVILLLCLLCFPLINRRWRLHDRWISYRFLSERLRSSYFLAIAGTSDRRERSARLEYFSDSSEAWLKRALTEVMARRPEIDAASFDVISLREYLIHHWIENQITYHKKLARRQHRIDNRLTRATELLFGITVVAAILHVLGVGEHGTHKTNWALLLIVLSISVPAIGAAIHGIAAQRQNRRHAQRNSRMASLLAELQKDMCRASSLGRVQELAVEAERIMREENSDWFGVVRFYDMELIT
jgi:SMODS and SLOG-associating 2TM effector domain 1